MMLEILIDDIQVVSGDRVFKQSVGIPMGVNYAPLLADQFFVFLWGRIYSKSFIWEEKSLASVFH